MDPGDAPVAGEVGAPRSVGTGSSVPASSPSRAAALCKNEELGPCRGTGMAATAGEVGAPASVGTGTMPTTTGVAAACGPSDSLGTFKDSASEGTSVGTTVPSTPPGAGSCEGVARCGADIGAEPGEATPPGNICSGSEVGENSPGEVGAPRSVGTGKSVGEDAASLCSRSGGCRAGAGGGGTEAGETPACLSTGTCCGGKEDGEN
mmetsp:Transcript_24907/g.57844  ORF Transcript_24907/g.57844 Transcript_24907/m.57844 type:complete len:206 (+) Transcript_24907:2019-2636(+)